MTVLPFVLAASAVLAPGRDHTALGGAIAKRVEAETPLFPDDADRRKTSALLVAVAFRESSLRNDIEGDHDARKVPSSFCAFQIRLPDGARTPEGWSGADLKASPERCVTVAFRMLRGSISACREQPADARLSGYAAGRCESETGKRISRDRFALSRRLLSEVHP